tara:strand:+ start:595 stop:780 length:186 start_codon:yes stop_codon:yes gene_type:complete
MEKKKYKRKKSLSKTNKVLQEIKNRVPNIIFKAHNIVVTLKNKNQLQRWLELYPEGRYTIN